MSAMVCNCLQLSWKTAVYIVQVSWHLNQHEFLETLSCSLQFYDSILPPLHISPQKSLDYKLFSSSSVAPASLLDAVTTLHWCTALYCTALLHCTALHCTVLHFTVVHCTILHCTVLHCTLLHCNALYTSHKCICNVNSPLVNSILH